MLKPGSSVEENPVGHVFYDEAKAAYVIVWGDIELTYNPSPEKSYFIINADMVMWIDELIQEIEKLRK